ncbi:MAG: HEAT repeat domain-containing protein [Thermodesulfobacteriota bacterium]
MNRTEENKTIRVDIASAEDLFRTLRHPDPKVRTMVLRAVQDKPAQAMACGTIEGRDVIDELLLLCAQTEGTMDRLAYAGTVLNLDDPRVAAFAKKEFLKTDNAGIILLAAKHIAALDWQKRVRLLEPVIRRAAPANQCRAAANLLADCRGLSPDVAIRVAVLSDHQVAPPPLSEKTLAAWLSELKGPYPRKTEALLKQQGNAALAVLLENRGQLPEDLQIRAMQWGLESRPGAMAPVLKSEIHEKTDGPVLQAALESLAQLGHAPDPDTETRIESFYDHPDPAVRAAAVLAGTKSLDWTAAVFAETEPTVRLAMISRMARSGRATDLYCLIDLLADTNWRIRARATEALVALAPKSLPLLRQTLENPAEPVRVAATQALFQLGKEEWIEEDLLV